MTLATVDSAFVGEASPWRIDLISILFQRRYAIGSSYTASHRSKSATLVKYNKSSAKTSTRSIFNPSPALKGISSSYGDKQDLLDLLRE
jgi:hypothetical protein